MSNLLQTAQKLQEELSQKETALEAESTRLAEWAATLESREQSLKQSMVEMDKVSQEAAAEVKKAERIKAIEQREKELIEKQREALSVEAKLRRWQNELATIETRQEADKARLDKLSAELSREKETYKETLRQEFFEEVKRRLPQ